MKESNCERDTRIALSLHQTSNITLSVAEATHGSDTDTTDASTSSSPNGVIDDKLDIVKAQSEDVVMVPSGNHANSEPARKESVEGLAKKKRKLGTSPGPEASTSASKVSVGKRRSEDHEDEKSVSEPPVRKRKRKEVEDDSACAGPSTSVSAPTTKRSRARRPRPRASSTYHEAPESGAYDAPVDPETAVLHAQVCGMLIEAMAMSRASSLPASALYKLVMQTQPALKTQRTEREWLRVFDHVLHAGEAARGSGMFGKVESSGKVCFFVLSLAKSVSDLLACRMRQIGRWKHSGFMFQNWTKTRSALR